MKEALDILMELLDRVALRLNVEKMLGMVCQPCCTAVIQLEESYTRRMAGGGAVGSKT